jgi:hypothetical protein
MTEEELNAIEARVLNANGGWRSGSNRLAEDFCTQARADMPALIAEVRNLQTDCAMLRAALALAEESTAKIRARGGLER